MFVIICSTLKDVFHRHLGTWTNGPIATKFIILLLCGLRFSVINGTTQKISKSQAASVIQQTHHCSYVGVKPSNVMHTNAQQYCNKMTQNINDNFGISPFTCDTRNMLRELWEVRFNFRSLQIVFLFFLMQYIRWTGTYQSIRQLTQSAPDFQQSAPGIWAIVWGALCPIIHIAVK